MCIKCELLELIRKYNALREFDFSVSSDKIPELSSEYSIISEDDKI